MTARAKSKRAPGERGALQLIEEALHLLRAVPLHAWVSYLFTTAAWVLGLLFFWAYTTWFMPSGETLAWLSLMLALLYLVLKIGQAEFCDHLHSTRIGIPLRRFGIGARWKLLLGQSGLHGFGLLLLPPALLIGAPLGWLLAWTHASSALAARSPREGLSRAALREAGRWPIQNHVGLAAIAGLTAVVWINLLVLGIALPWLANRLLGVENLFALNGWQILNSTFLVGVTALSWMIVDPLVKAFYVLRVFYGRSVLTGDDLRGEFRTLAAGARLARRLAVVILSLGAFALSPKTAASTEAPSQHSSSHEISPAALDQQIDRVLEGSEYQWRLRSPKANVTSEAKKGAVERFFERAISWAKDAVSYVGRLWKQLTDWLDSLFPKGGSQDDVRRDRPGITPMLSVIFYVLLGVAVVLLAVMIVLAIKKKNRDAIPSLQARSLLTPDLADESITAAQLPTNEWIELARSKIQSREWRLALRALYLGTLSRLADDQWISLARHKTNQQYERELRRTLPPDEVRQRFRRQRLTFESVWYGHAVATEDEAHRWMKELEGTS